MLPDLVRTAAVSADPRPGQLRDETCDENVRKPPDLGHDAPMRSRRQFLQAAGSIGATLAMGMPRVRAQGKAWTERREFFPQGVASGDPGPNSVIVWTRLQPRTGDTRRSHRILAEVARDQAF
jgi:hypothetical protein